MKRTIFFAAVVFCMATGGLWAEAPSAPAQPSAPAGGEETAPPAAPPVPAKQLCDMPSLRDIDWIGPAVDLDALWGQAYMLVFVETWCPICNGWASDLGKQVEEAAKDRPMTIIYLGVDLNKTEMQSYMKGKGLQGHTMGVVPAFVAKECGFDKTLWRCVVIDPQGRRAAKTMFGMYYEEGSKMVSALAREMPRYCGDAKAVVEKRSPPALEKADLAVRLGVYSAALALLEKSGEAGAEGKARLLARGKGMLDAAKAYRTEDPYLAWRLANVVAREFKTTPMAKEARTLLAELAKDEKVRRESAAEIVLAKIFDMVKKKTPEQTVEEGLKQLGLRYGDCRAGRIALRTFGEPADGKAKPALGE